MDRTRPRRSGARLALASLGCLLLFGCSRGDVDTPQRHVPEENSNLPVVAESLEDIRAQMAGLIRVENERYVIASPEEFESWRLKALIKLDEVRRREGVDGFTQAPVEKTGSQHGVVDAESRKIAWRASTCWNPTCLGKGKGGGPLVFVRSWENAWIDTDGRLKWKTITEPESTPPTACPVCGRLEFVQPYDLPDVEIRRRQLGDELSNARRIRAEREAAGQLVPAGVRTPTEIMKETAQLPKLFLVPE
jgi:hypothetical protein